MNLAVTAPSRPPFPSRKARPTPVTDAQTGRPLLELLVCSGRQAPRPPGSPRRRAGGQGGGDDHLLGGRALAAGSPQRPRHRPRSQASEPGRGGRGGGSGHATSWHHHLLQRSLVLFSVGVVLALVLNLLQVQRNVTLFPEEVIATIFSSAWWVPPCCGTAAEPRAVTSWRTARLCLPSGLSQVPCRTLSPHAPGCVRSSRHVPHAFRWLLSRNPTPAPGSILFYSLMLSNSGGCRLAVPLHRQSPWEPHKFKREWASVMRCVAVFVGINHASAKLDFANNVQLSLTLAALSLGLWWTFDRSRSGLGLGITIAFLATLITQLLVYNGVYQYTSPDFLYIRSWLPCIFFSGGVTVGNIGRQLAMGVPEKPHSD
ncbi:hypothetical protein QTO34_004877 [Cnephaeus nilssonii]|uniref:Insulin-induced gene protein n=1 Tax=Cnephaeus nilssonii TaxID=3371016 RepID=A0AA40HR59_CNENI|nr:hypothetical protein QTO34_004877 [Eptesicus nilssonii]